MGVSSPQTHSARYCFFGGRTHPAVTLASLQGLAVARFLMRCALPARPARYLVPLVAPTAPVHLAIFVTLSRACFLPPRFHHLLLFEPAVALELWFARQHYSPSPCPFPAILTASLHHIKSISGPDRVGPRCAIAMFYFGLGPAGGNTNLLDTSSPKAIHRPTRPTHDNSPSR